MAEVRGLALLRGVVGLVNDNIQVPSEDGSILAKLLKIEAVLSVVSVAPLDELGESQRPEVADRRLFGGGELNDLGAQVGGLDGSEVLLVGLGITRVLVQQIRPAGLNLGIYYHLPQFLSRDLPHGEVLALIVAIQLRERITPAVRQSRAGVGTEHGPIPILLHTLHKQVRDPQSIEQITSTLIVVARVQLQTQKLLNVSMPRLQIDRKRPIALSTLVHILGRVIEDLQHRRDARGLAIGALDLSIASPNVVNAQTNATRPLGDLRTLAQRIVDPLDTVILHVDQKARAQLGMRCSRVEQSGCGVNEIPLTQGIVGLLDLCKVRTMKLDSHAHPHVLGTLPHTAITTAEQVALLQRLVAKIVKHEIPRVVDH